ncbi:MAG: helix-turn-helix transcriptional regulator [Clostridia bacterium]|nr:helix-turn-helix transcriptional regulator [Clostridia bacterium]
MEIGMRITQLREERNWKKTELARRLGISHSQVSRSESGETGTLSSDILIRLAEVFDVSADYLLGLTDVRTKKNLDVVQMNISEDAAIQLASGKLDLEMLSRLLEHKEFAKVLFLMRAYLDNSLEIGNMARNEMIDFMTDMADEWSMSRPKKQQEVQKDMLQLSAQKLCTHEADMEKIKNLFMKILRDVKKMDHRELPKQTMTASMLNAFREKIRAKWGRREKIEKEDVIFIVLEKLNERIPMDDVSRSLLAQLMLRLMNAMAAQSQVKMHAPHIGEEVNTKTAV